MSWRPLPSLRYGCCSRCLPTSLLWSCLEDKPDCILFLQSLGEVIVTSELKSTIILCSCYNLPSAVTFQAGPLLLYSKEIFIFISFIKPFVNSTEICVPSIYSLCYCGLSSSLYLKSQSPKIYPQTYFSINL